MVRMSAEEVSIYQHKRLPPEAVKAHQDKLNQQAEKELQKEMAGFLRLRGIEFLSSRMDRKTTAKVGWPDFTFAVNGRACAVEAKVGSNCLSEDQKAVMAKLQANGWRVGVVRNLVEFKIFLDTEGAL